MEVTDEELIAYLDGEAASDEKLRLDQLIAGDPGLQHRLAAFRELDDQIAEAHQSIECLPYPSEIMDMLSLAKGNEQAPEKNTAGKQDPSLVRLKIFVAQTFSGSNWTSLTATACALALGTLLGSQLFPSSDSSIRSPAELAGLITPDNPLYPTLEYGPANVANQVFMDQDATAMAILTFRADDARYCREFTVSTAQQSARGIACRKGGEWSLELMVRDGSVSIGDGQYSTASSIAASALDDLFNSLTSDVPMDASAEARLIESGWVE